MSILLDEILRTVDFLENGKIVLSPTDTIWGLSCDATNFEAVEKIFSIKNRSTEKSLIVLVSSIEMLKKYVNKIPKNLQQIIDSYSNPVTVIYEKAMNIPDNVFAKNGSIAIRIVKDGFCNQLIETFGRPIISTSANFSNEETPKTFQDVSRKLKDEMDHVVEEQFGSEKKTSSTIIKIEDGRMMEIRK